jgi:transposase-like protein
MSRGGNSDKWGINSDYTPEYRRWVAEQVAIQGKTVAQVAREQDLTVGLVSGWHGALGQGHYNGVIAAPFPRLQSEAIHASQRGAARTRRRARRFSVEFKRGLIESADSRNIPLAQVAREADVALTQAYRWQSEYHAGKFGPVDALPLPPTAAPSLVPVAPSTPQQNGITVQLPGGTAVIPQGADADTIKAVITALQASAPSRRTNG